MKTTPIYLEAEDSQKLLSCRNPDAVTLYIYLRNGNTPAFAKSELDLSSARFDAALNTLRSLGLYKLQVAEIPKPIYRETDVLTAMHQDMDFQALTREVQYRLGKALNVEELKVLLNISRYMGLPNDVICVLINHCVTSAKQRGILKVPSLWTMEKEAARWADAGIDNVKAALAFSQQQTAQHSQMGRLMEILHIRGRQLTSPEMKYAESWLRMGFREDMLRKAYEKTCMNTGGMNWPYMDKVLTAWKKEGYKTPDDIKRKGQSQSTWGSGQLGEAEMEAVRKIMSMDADEFLGSDPSDTKKSFL